MIQAPEWSKSLLRQSDRKVVINFETGYGRKKRGAVTFFRVAGVPRLVRQGWVGLGWIGPRDKR
jgi:hypothetical protein